MPNPDRRDPQGQEFGSTAEENKSRGTLKLLPGVGKGENEVNP
ncbi:hypothetical protein [Oscillatoria acuminata]|nr:hypothetical protein [Oscillatoria acuminata]